VFGARFGSTVNHHRTDAELEVCVRRALGLAVRDDGGSKSLHDLDGNIEMTKGTPPRGRAGTKAPMARLTREESRALTREKLLDAAALAFARHGYGGASVDTISESAGFSKGAFYSNFASKEAIFIELLRRHMVREAEELRKLLDVEGGFEGTIAALSRWFETMNQDADWALLSMELQLQASRAESVAAACDELIRDHRARLGALVEDLFAAAGKALPCPADDVASLFIAIGHGMVLTRTGRHDRSRDPTGALIKLVLDSLVRAAPGA
jgi:AcrR family transcriptional regulator